MLGSIPNFNNGAVIAVVMLIPSVLCIFTLTYLEKYNFKYDKISEIKIQKNKTKDINFSVISIGVVGTIISYGAALITCRSNINKKFNLVIESIALIPNTIPGMVLGIAFLLTFTGTSIQNTFAILIICNIVHFFSTPYLMMKNSLSKMNVSSEVISYYFVNSMVTISAVIFLTSA